MPDNLITCYWDIHKNIHTINLRKKRQNQEYSANGNQSGFTNKLIH